MPYQPSLLSLGLLFCLAACEVAGPEPEVRPDQSRLPELRAVTYGAGRFVAVGRRETWSTTAHSSTWKALADSTVAVWSDDGIEWHPASLPERSGWLRDVAFGNDVFVALGGIGNWIEADAYTLRSSDGATWTKAAPPLGLMCNWLEFAEGSFVASCSEGANRRNVIARSVDGINWIRATTFDDYQAPVTRAGDLFFRSSRGLSWSEDGATWHSVPPFWPNRDAEGRVLLAQIGQVVFANGEYVAAAWSAPSYGEHQGPRTDYNLRSADGRSWRLVTPAREQIFEHQASGNGVFVGIATNGLHTSSDMVDWTRTHAFDATVYPYEEYYFDVHFDAGKFVAVGQRGILTSTDGSNWSTSSIPFQR